MITLKFATGKEQERALEMRERVDVLNKEQQTLANYHGTSNIIKPKKGYRMFNPKRSKDQQEIIEFTLDYQQHLRQRFGYTNDYEHASSDTSDDTKETRYDGQLQP
ncbi:16273_t:CDS:2 [Rhizophagus irregularis]|nr:hypothetical protein RhiirB3_434730 [Rhizophagus irregularis]CAG8728234.1 16273_t:CDS:2 [Rhizophagus irregularis]